LYLVGTLVLGFWLARRNRGEEDYFVAGRRLSGWLAGASMAGAVVAMPGSRGSSGTPGVLGEALRTGAGPAALIVTKADINLVAGAMVAESLYGVDCPVLLVDGETFASLTTGTRVEHAGPGSLVD